VRDAISYAYPRYCAVLPQSDSSQALAVRRKLGPAGVLVNLTAGPEPVRVTYSVAGSSGGSDTGTSRMTFHWPSASFCHTAT
jgi:hypothetical protein